MGNLKVIIALKEHIQLKCVLTPFRYNKVLLQHRLNKDSIVKFNFKHYYSL